MSLVSCNCFDGLNIEKCACNWGGIFRCFRCCHSNDASRDEGDRAGIPEEDSKASSTPSVAGPRRRHAKNKKSVSPEEHMVLVQDLALNLTTINAPHYVMQTIGANTGAFAFEGWDYMIIDTELKLTMMAGKLFNNFCTDKQISESDCVDLGRGRPIVTIFPQRVSEILIKMANVALEGKCGQLHTFYKNKSLTMFVFPLFNDYKQPIGAFIEYRPTYLEQRDLREYISVVDGLAPAINSPQLAPVPSHAVRAATFPAAVYTPPPPSSSSTKAPTSTSTSQTASATTTTIETASI